MSKSVDRSYGSHMLSFQMLNTLPALLLFCRLTQHFGLTPNDYTAVRCGMNVSKAIKKGEIDAGECSN
jgi:hypothetical protein